MGNAVRIKPGKGIGYAFGTTVGDVIAGQADHGEPRPGDRGDILGRRARRRDVPLHLGSARGVWHFQMTDGEIGGANRRRNSVEPVGCVRFIKNEIARQHDGDRLPVHAAFPHHRDRQNALRTLMANSRPIGSAAVASYPPLPLPLGARFT